MHEPVVLDRLLKIARRMGGDAHAYVGDALELGASPRILLRARELPSPLRVALRETYEGVSAYAHRLELIPLRLRLRAARDASVLRPTAPESIRKLSSMSRLKSTKPFR